jgi:acetylornithine deacetylase/succinyl-diaminopimelate desuccinylase-like protein
MSEPLQPVLKKLEADFEPAIERVSALLRIPSISTDPAYRGDVQRCAAHVADDLSSIGFESTVHETDGHPVVTARHAGPAGAPRVLYYGHYDVQPPDPLELWDSPPFEPTIVEGPHGRRLIARGAVDDKGQLMTFVEAFRAWRDVHGTLPVNVTVLLEGEEESGSPHRHVGHRHPGGHLHAQGHGLRRGHPARAEPRPALGHVRRRGRQPGQ